MVKDKKVHDLIEQLRNKYHMFMSNSFIKNYIYEADIPRSIWVGIEDLLDANHYYESMGYDLHKLYEQMLSFARFLDTLRKDVVPRMQREFRARLSTLSGNNQVIFKMTVNNAPGNVQNFFEIAGDLFQNVLRIDEKTNGEGSTVYRRSSEYHEIQRILSV
jgi:hypothetical protein